MALPFPWKDVYCIKEPQTGSFAIELMTCHPLSDKQESANNMRILYKGAANLTTQQPHIMHHEFVASLSDIEWTKINQT